MKRLPILTLVLALLTVLVARWPGAAEALQLDRDAVLHGQIWRLVTGHLTHFDHNHLTWDVAALVLLGALTEPTHRPRFVLTLFASAFTISLAVLVLQPAFTCYRGLSGLDSALFGLVVVRLAHDGWRARHGFSLALAALAGGGFLLKCGYEVASGTTYFAAGSGYLPVPLAHLVGFITGAVVGLPVLIPPPFRARQETITAPQ